MAHAATLCLGGAGLIQPNRNGRAAVLTSLARVQLSTQDAHWAFHFAIHAPTLTFVITKVVPACAKSMRWVVTSVVLVCSAHSGKIKANHFRSVNCVSCATGRRGLASQPHFIKTFPTRAMCASEARPIACRQHPENTRRKLARRNDPGRSHLPSEHLLCYTRAPLSTRSPGQSHRFNGSAALEVMRLTPFQQFVYNFCNITNATEGATNRDLNKLNATAHYLGDLEDH